MHDDVILWPLQREEGHARAEHREARGQCAGVAPHHLCPCGPRSVAGGSGITEERCKDAAEDGRCDEEELDDAGSVGEALDEQSRQDVGRNGLDESRAPQGVRWPAPAHEHHRQGDAQRGEPEIQYLQRVKPEDAVGVHVAEVVQRAGHARREEHAAGIRMHGEAPVNDKGSGDAGKVTSHQHCHLNGVEGAIDPSLFAELALPRIRARARRGRDSQGAVRKQGLLHGIASADQTGSRTPSARKNFDGDVHPPARPCVRVRRICQGQVAGRLDLNVTPSG
mmetsp:Transcript_32209/g.102454  ORF Transcript_32209/g.102454 Transcript_32209/m.102454 type:complete len:280 (-) Transcript_32209:1108-1947(-)